MKAHKEKSKMNLKCKDCGTVRSKAEAYTGKYALENVFLWTVTEAKEVKGNGN